MTEEERVEELGLLAKEASGCVACRLAETRTHVVFEDGNRLADVMFIGEAPGFHEDQQGIPFVGAAGGLLDRLLAEIALSRPEVYIANVLKCRPPGNRDPQADEIEACKGYLARQVKLVDPVVVVTLGNFSTRLLLKTTAGISRLRGTAYPWWGRTVVPTFHPAAALRGGDRVLNQMRDDFALLRRVLDGPPAEETAAPTGDDPAPQAEATQLDLFEGGPA